MHPICQKCNQEIKPGEQVNIVTLDDIGTRIFASNDILYAHVKCPELVTG
jgi:hypothetical protein